MPMNRPAMDDDAQFADFFNDDEETLAYMKTSSKNVSAPSANQNTSVNNEDINDEEGLPDLDPSFFHTQVDEEWDDDHNEEEYIAENNYNDVGEQDEDFFDDEEEPEWEDRDETPHRDGDHTSLSDEEQNDADEETHYSLDYFLDDDDEDEEEPENDALEETPLDMNEQDKNFFDDEEDEWPVEVEDETFPDEDPMKDEDLNAIMASWGDIDEDDEEEPQSRNSLVEEDDVENLDEEENTENNEDGEEPTKKTVGGFSAKMAEFKRKAKAELKGKEAPDVVDEDEAKDATPEDRGENDPHGASPARSGGGGRFTHLPLIGVLTRLLRSRPFLFIGRLLRPVKNIYLSLTNLLFSMLDSILRILGSLPVIGKPFQWLRQFTQIIRYVATCIPLLLLLILVVHLNRGAVPPTVNTEAPDSGQLTASHMEYDGDKRTVSGTLRNTGDVILKTQPEFEVYSSSLLHPLSWPFPRKAATCTAAPLQLEIGEVRRITAHCDDVPGGFFKKTTMKLNVTE